MSSSHEDPCSDVCKSRDTASPIDQDYQQINQQLKTMLTDATLTIQALPHCPEISLYLVEPNAMQRPFSSQEVTQIENYPCYWAFCWASGQVLARYILDNPQIVKDKKVLDFGAGSGVVAIAAMLAGADMAIACDLDPDALAASRINAALNQVEISCLDDLHHAEFTTDLLIAADVLYDRSNLPLLDTFLVKANQTLIGDSRIRDFSHEQYHKIHQYSSMTVPDLDEADEFRHVSLYQSLEHP